jgi:hypothetical protein
VNREARKILKNTRKQESVTERSPEKSAVERDSAPLEQTAGPPETLFKDSAGNEMIYYCK